MLLGGSIFDGILNGDILELSDVIVGSDPVAPVFSAAASFTPAAAQVGDTITIFEGIASGTPAPVLTYTLTLDGADVSAEVTGGEYIANASGELQIVVTATNSEGSAQSTATITVADVSNLITTAQASEVSDPVSGVTYRFVDASGLPEQRTVWNYANGDWGVLGGIGNPVRIGSITPDYTFIADAALEGGTNPDVGTRILHGATLNPGRRTNGVNNLHGYTNFERRENSGDSYDPAENIDPARTGQPIVLEQGCVAKSVSYTGTDIPPGGETATLTITYLTIAPSIPNAGAFRPGCAAADKSTPAVLGQLQRDLLPTDMDIAGLTNMPIYASISQRIARNQNPYLHFEETGRESSASQHHAAYSSDHMEGLAEVAAYMCDQNLAEATRDEIRIAICQFAIDIFSKVLQGVTSRINGGHAAGERWILYLGGKMLGIVEMILASGLFIDLTDETSWLYGDYPDTPGAWSGDHFKYAKIIPYLTNKPMTGISRNAETYRDGSVGIPERWGEGLNGKAGLNTFRNSNASFNEAYRVIMAQQQAVLIALCYLMPNALAELGQEEPLTYHDRFDRAFDLPDIRMGRQNWANQPVGYLWKALRARIAYPVWTGQPEALPWRNSDDSSAAFWERVGGAIRYVPCKDSNGQPFALDNGSAITSYDIQYRTGNPTSAWTLVQDAAWDGTGYVLPNAPQGLVQAEIRAVNANGPGPWQNSGHGRAAISNVQVTDSKISRGSALTFAQSAAPAFALEVTAGSTVAEFFDVLGVPIPGEAVTEDSSVPGDGFTYDGPIGLRVFADDGDVIGSVIEGQTITFATSNWTGQIHRVSVADNGNYTLELINVVPSADYPLANDVLTTSGGGTATISGARVNGMLAFAVLAPGQAIYTPASDNVPVAAFPAARAGTPFGGFVSGTPDALRVPATRDDSRLEMYAIPEGWNAATDGEVAMMFSPNFNADELQIGPFVRGAYDNGAGTFSVLRLEVVQNGTTALVQLRQSTEAGQGAVLASASIATLVRTEDYYAVFRWQGDTFEITFWNVADPRPTTPTLQHTAALGLSGGLCGFGRKTRREMNLYGATMVSGSGPAPLPVI